MSDKQLIYQAAAKTLFFTTASNSEGAPIFTSSAGRTLSAVGDVTVTQTPFLINQGGGQAQYVNYNNELLIDIFQAGQATVNLFQSTYKDKKVFVGVEDTSDKFHYSSQSMYLRSRYELNLGKEGFSKLTEMGTKVTSKAKNFWVSDDASVLPRSGGVNLDSLSEFSSGPLCQVSWSQDSGSNSTSSIDDSFMPEGTIIVWEPQTVAIACGDVLEKNGKLTIDLNLVETGTGSIDQIEDTFRQNKAFFDFKYEDHTGALLTVSSAVSGGVKLSQVINRNFQQAATDPHNRILHGETITDTILDSLNLPA